jgi:hypothetical protein
MRNNKKMEICKHEISSVPTLFPKSSLYQRAQSLQHRNGLLFRRCRRHIIANLADRTRNRIPYSPPTHQNPITDSPIKHTDPHPTPVERLSAPRVQDRRWMQWAGPCEPPAPPQRVQTARPAAQ